MKTCINKDTSTLKNFKDNQKGSNLSNLTNLSQNASDKVFLKKVNCGKSKNKLVLHVGEPFDQPHKNNQKVDVSIMTKQTESLENVQNISNKRAKSINFVKERVSNSKKHKFLTFVPRRKNLKEYETTV